MNIEDMRKQLAEYPALKQAASERDAWKRLAEGWEQNSDDLKRVAKGWEQVANEWMTAAMAAQARVAELERAVGDAYAEGCVDGLIAMVGR